MMRHLDDETLSALLDQELEREEAFAVEAHLRECSSCRDRMQALQRASRLLSGLPRRHAPEDLGRRVMAAARPPRSAMRRYLPLAASIAAVTALTFVIWRAGLEREPAEEARTARLEQEAASRERAAPGSEAASRSEPSPSSARRVEKKASPKERADLGGMEQVPEQTERSHRVNREMADLSEAPPASPAEELARRDRSLSEPSQAEEDTAAGESFEAGGVAPRRPALQAETEAMRGPTEPPVSVLRLSIPGEAGDRLGDLELRLEQPAVLRAPTGIRLLCEPERNGGYGGSENPVVADRVPRGFAWPRLASRDTEVDSMAIRSDSERRERRAGARPPSLPVTLEGSLIVEPSGTVRASGLPPWLRGRIEALDFEPGLCPSGAAATTSVPFEARWMPVSQD